MRSSTQLVVTWAAISALSGTCADPGPTLVVPLEFVTGEQCRFDARNAVVLAEQFVPTRAGAVVIECERPTRCFRDPSRFRPADPFTDDPTAWGGRCLRGLSYARYEFRLPDAADYTVWLRLSSTGGRCRLRDLVDGRGFTAVLDEDASEQDRPWHWVRRGAVRLSRGVHHLELVPAGYGVPHLDAVALSPDPDWRPPDAPLLPATEAPADGWVETADLRLPGLLALLPPSGWPGRGVSAEVSLDSGTTWQSVAGGSPVPCADLPARFRFRLARGSAVIDGAVPVRLGEGAVIDLRHADTRLVLDRGTGGLVLVQNAATGETVSGGGQAWPLLDIEFKRPGEPVWIRRSPTTRSVFRAERGRSGRWARRREGGDEALSVTPDVAGESPRVTLSWHVVEPGWGEADVVVRIEPAEQGLWRFAVTCRSLAGPADVVSVAFPVFHRVRLGASGLDDRQLRVQSFGHRALQPGRAPVRDDRYLGATVMPWTDVHDPRGGFYVGSHDPTATNLLFESRAGGPAAEHFTMATRKLDDVHPGEAVTYEYRVAAHPGDWHWGAERYGAWFRQTYGTGAYPPWLQAADGWVGLQAENYGKAFRFEQLGDWLTHARAVGLDWVQVWGQFAYDGGPCCSNFYALSPLYGGSGAWTEAARRIRARGGHIGAYFLYHGLDLLPLVTDTFLGHFAKDEYGPDTPWVTPELFQRLRLIDDPAGGVPQFPPPDDELAAKLEAIAAHRKTYAEGGRAMPVHWWHGTYVDDPEWIDYLRSWIVDRYQVQYHNDAVYIDVLGTGQTPESYDPRRGHNGDGGYSRGRLTLAREIARAVRANNPDYGLTMEGMGDLPGLHFASMCSGVYRGARNVMRYTFPERIFIHGTANSRSGGGMLDRFLTTFLEGMRYDHQGRYPAAPVIMLGLQRQVTPWLYQARFLDTVGLATSSPRISVRRFRLGAAAPFAGHLVTMVNPERLRGQFLDIDLTRVGTIATAFCRDLAGSVSRADATAVDGRLRMPLPASTAAVLVLAEGGDCLLPMTYLKRHGRPELRVSLLNTDADAAKSGTCAVRVLGLVEPFSGQREAAEAALPFETTTARFTVPAGDCATVAFPLRHLDAHRWSIRVAVDVVWGRERRLQREILLTPLVLGGGWELTGGEPGVAWEGRCSLRLGPTTEGYQYRLPDFWVEPAHRYRFSVMQRRDGFEADVRGVRITVRDNRGNDVYTHQAADVSRPGEWQALTGEFDTPWDVTRAGLYLYNVRSRHTAWFDDLRLWDLGPIEDGEMHP